MNQPKHIILEVTGNIGIIRFDNPPGNFLENPEFITGELLDDWIEDSGLKGILFYSTGKHFSGGAKLEDLFTMAQEENLLKQEMEKGRILLNHIHSLTIPVIAAIHGACFGGGLEIALACHMRICSDKALFAFPEINHGIIPGLGGVESTVKLSSFQEAMNFILGGDMISAEEAFSMKIVDKVVPPNMLFDHSFSLLKKMTGDRSLKVIRYVMTALHNVAELSKEDAIREETRMFCELAMDEAQRRKSE